jgi:hypothetical protein
MRLKKLILPFLGLFVLSALSYAGTMPTLIFKPITDSIDIRCNSENQTEDSEYPSLTTGKLFKVGKYAGQRMSAWTLLENALKKNDKLAVEILKYCVRSNNHGDLTGRINENGLTLLQVSAYYDGDNAKDIIKYLIEKQGWGVDAIYTFSSNGIKGDRNALAAAAEVDNKVRAELLVKNYRANPKVKIYDNSTYNDRGKITIVQFAEVKESKGVLDYFTTLPQDMISLMDIDAAYKNINYAMTNKDEFSRLMEKIKSNGIVADFLRALDGNTLMRTNYNLI